MAPSARLKSFTDRYPYLGPLIWVATLEYFVVQYVVAANWPSPYSLLRNPISDLGNTSCGLYDGRQVCSPQYPLMNLAFVGLGVLMVVGAPLIHQEFRERRLATLGFCGMAIAGLGTILVGLSPENVNLTVHVFGAAGPFVVGNVALVILSCTLMMSMSVRVVTGLAGGIGLVGTLPIRSRCRSRSRSGRYGAGGCISADDLADHLRRVHVEEPLLET